MKAGIHYNISNSDYHASKGVSKSRLDVLARSPAHYFAKYLDKDNPKKDEPTAAMIAGTLAHCAILEPDEFGLRYVVLPTGLDRRTKEGKAAFAELEASGKEVILEDQYKTAQRQAASVCRLPDIAMALEKGRAEVSAYWTDEKTGLLCKCRPDLVYSCEAGDILLDVKTTKDASPREFSRSIANYRYDVQAAFYSDGYALASGRRVLAFIFVAVESEYPHLAAAYQIDEASIMAGREKYRRDLETLKNCHERNEWPGYSTAIEPISLPAWAMIA